MTTKAPPEPIEYVTPAMRDMLDRWIGYTRHRGVSATFINHQEMVQVREEVLRLASLYAEALGIASDMAAERGLGTAVSSAELHEALAESVKLQSHYAELLNMYDGGERRGFDTPEAWMARLKECKRHYQ